MDMHAEPPRPEPEAPSETAHAASTAQRGIRRIAAIILAPFKYGLAAVGITISAPLIAGGLVLGVCTIAATISLLVGGVLGIIGLIVGGILAFIGLILGSIIAGILIIIVTVVVGAIAAILLLALAEIVLRLFDQITGLNTAKILNLSRRTKDGIRAATS